MPWQARGFARQPARQADKTGRASAWLSKHTHERAYTLHSTEQSTRAGEVVWSNVLSVCGRWKASFFTVCLLFFFSSSLSRASTSRIFPSSPRSNSSSSTPRCPASPPAPALYLGAILRVLPPGAPPLLYTAPALSSEQFFEFNPQVSAPPPALQLRRGAVYHAKSPKVPRRHSLARAA